MVDPTPFNTCGTTLVYVFNKLSHEDKIEFIRCRNPVLVKVRSLLPDVLKKYGHHYFCIELDNGWRFFASSTRVSAIKKFNEFMNKE